MKKKLIMMMALVFCLGVFPAATGAKETVQASGYDDDDWDDDDDDWDDEYDDEDDQRVTYQENGKTVYEDTSDALRDKCICPGKSWTFSIADESETDEDSYETITPTNVSWKVEGDAVSIVSQETNGLTFEVKAEALGTATLSVTYDIAYSSYIYRYTSTAFVTVAEKTVYKESSDVLEKQSVAKGKSRTISIADVTETDWDTGETVTPTNIKWKVKGAGFTITSKTTTGTSLKVKAAASGKAKISVTYDMEYNDAIYRYTSKATIYVTNPKLSAKTIGINKYFTTYSSMKITGCNAYSTITCTPSSKKVDAYAYYNGSGSMNLYVEASKKGNYTVKLNIDGKAFTVKVCVFSAYFQRNTEHSVDSYMDKKWHEGDTILVLYKGEKETLTIKGLSTGTKVKWKSSNKNVATVNQKGVVLAKGSGHCTITASFNGSSITYEVGVASKTATKAVYYAIKHFGSIYSQEERMAEGKYDCSSYIYRAYKDAGVSLGTSSNWAPTAADLAKWCSEKGYVLYTETQTVDVSKLLPGDLIFETGENNGRYKGIYHVDLYTGNGSSLTVQRAKYWGDSITGVIVARPCK